MFSSGSSRIGINLPFQALLASELNWPFRLIYGLENAVPTAYIGATRRIADLELFRSYCPQLMSSQVFGSGHFLPLEVPEQVNSMLDRLLSSLGARSADDCTGRGVEFDAWL
jgi:hypothetical protein